MTAQNKTEYKGKRRNNTDKPVSMNVRPPVNIEAEIQVLGTMLYNKSVIPKVVSRFGGPEEGKKFFYSENNKTIYEGIAKSFEAGHNPDLTFMMEYFGDDLKKVGGAAYMMTLVESSIGTITDFTLDTLEKKYFERRRLNAIYEVRNLMAEYQAEGEREIDFLSESGRIMREDLFHDLRRERSIKEICREVINEWQTRAKEGGIAGLQSHIPAFDAITGGFCKQRLYVVGGRPGMGKTSLCLEFCDEVVRAGGRAAFITLEMPDTQIVGRLVSQRARVPFTVIQNDPKLVTAEQWDIMYDAFAELRDGKWVIIDQPGADIGRICAMIENAHHDDPLSIACVDYLQIVGGLDINNLVKDLERACTLLRDTARRCNIPILLISQLSREPEKRKGQGKRPVLADLRDSGGIEQNADLAVFVYRESQYNSDMSGDAAKVVELITAKNRYGPCKTVFCLFDGPTTHFYQNNVTLAEIADSGDHPTLKMDRLRELKCVDYNGKPVPTNVTKTDMERMREDDEDPSQAAQGENASDDQDDPFAAPEKRNNTEKGQNKTEQPPAGEQEGGGAPATPAQDGATKASSAAPGPSGVAPPPGIKGGEPFDDDYGSILGDV